MVLLCCPKKPSSIKRRVPTCLTSFVSQMATEVMVLPITSQRNPTMCANIMNQKILALLHAAAGMEMHVQTHHVAVTPRKMIVVGIVNGQLVSASQQCSKHAQRRAHQDPMCAQRVAHLWTIVSSVSLQLGFGKRITVQNLGKNRQDLGHKVASGIGSSTLSAISLNQVPHTRVGWTKLERRRESGQSARS